MQILVIEDEPLVRRSILDLLEAKGYHTQAAANGLEGLQMARAHLPDLILCDVNMPKLDGWGVLQALRAEPDTRSIPLIFLTAMGDRSDVRHGMEMGAEDYVTKPFDPGELLAAVDTQLKKRAILAAAYETTIRLVCKNITYILPHELRTPLSSILGYADLLRMDYNVVTPEQILEYSEWILRAGSRLQRVIENYLVYAQIEIASTNAEELEKFRNHLVASVASVIGDEAHKIAEQSGRLDDLHLELHDLALQISEHDLRKIVGELVDNALKFSEPGTPVYVSAILEENVFTLSISDRGRGMTAEQIRSVGEYMQFERLVYEQQGLGLGLIIASRLAELHQGRLAIQSMPGSGTVVSVRFPSP